MASLRLPRLCCLHADEGTELVTGSDVYHAACAVSAILALLGLTCCYPFTEKRQCKTWRMGARIRLASALLTAGTLNSWRQHGHFLDLHLQKFRTGLISCCLACRSLLLDSVLWLSVPDFLSNQVSWPAHIVCILISTWIHYFCCVIFWAFFCYSLEIAQLLSSDPSERFERLFTFLCWGGPSLMILHGLLMLIPSENRCDSKEGLVLFHDVSFYIPLLLALFGSPFLLRRAIVRVPTVLKMQCGVYTCSERFRQQSLCRRLIQISGTLVVCWIVNVLCDIILLLVEVWGTSETPRQLQVTALTLFIIMGILNPMFCCVHSLAFFGWRSSAACMKQTGAAPESPPDSSRDGDLLDEKHLLLQMQSMQPTGQLSVPEILQLMDSCSSVEFRCSPYEINAVRLLGTQDFISTLPTDSELKSQPSSV